MNAESRGSSRRRVVEFLMNPSWNPAHPGDRDHRAQRGARQRALSDKRYGVIYADPLWRSNPMAWRRVEVTVALKPAHEHSYRLSAYERKANDFYPTPSDLAVSLALGLPRLGLDLPRVALDPCGGDGALRSSLLPFGVDVRLTDLYPDMYPAADSYVTSQPADAAEPEQLCHALKLAGSDCTAIITNTPHNTDEACAIVRNLVALVEGRKVEFAAALFRSIWGAEPGRLPYLNRPSFFGEILCCLRPRWIAGSQGSPMHAYAWYVWRKEPRSGPSLKVRVARREAIATPAK
jgi:hypothetical protein